MEDPIINLAWSLDNRYIAYSRKNSVIPEIHDTLMNELCTANFDDVIKSHLNECKSINAIEWMSNDRFVTSSFDGKLILYEIINREIILRLIKSIVPLLDGLYTKYKNTPNNSFHISEENKKIINFGKNNIMIYLSFNRKLKFLILGCYNFLFKLELVENNNNKKNILKFKTNILMQTNFSIGKILWNPEGTVIAVSNNNSYQDAIKYDHSLIYFFKFIKNNNTLVECYIVNLKKIDESTIINSVGRSSWTSGYIYLYILGDMCWSNNRFIYSAQVSEIKNKKNREVQYYDEMGHYNIARYIKNGDEYYTGIIEYSFENKIPSLSENKILSISETCEPTTKYYYPKIITYIGNNIFMYTVVSTEKKVKDMILFEKFEISKSKFTHKIIISDKINRVACGFSNTSNIKIAIGTNKLMLISRDTLYNKEKINSIRTEKLTQFKIKEYTKSNPIYSFIRMIPFFNRVSKKKTNTITQENVKISLANNYNKNNIKII